MLNHRLPDEHPKSPIGQPRTSSPAGSGLDNGPRQPAWRIEAKLAFMAVMLFLSQVLTTASFGSGHAGSLPSTSFVPGELLISLTPDAMSQLSTKRLHEGFMGLPALDEQHSRLGVETIAAVFATKDPLARSAGLTRIFKVTLPPGGDVFSALSAYSQEVEIEFAELNLIYTALITPSDPRFRNQWALHNSGQEGGKQDADIDAREAWDLEQGAPGVVIAIVDTGIDPRHQDLKSGRVLAGYDFANDDADPMDDHGHGTYVAGIAGADANNRKGVSGICWRCRLLPVKVLDSEGSGTAEWVAQGIRYAADQQAQIINMSLGFEAGCGCSKTVARAINYAWKKGSLMVAASGNDSKKDVISYPASSPRVLAVGASDDRDREASFSNRSNAVDLLAPGEDILGLDARPGEARYREASGTSAATPHAAGVAGLVWSARPDLKNYQVWETLRSNTDKLSGNLPGRLNARKALNNIQFGNFSAPQDTCSEEPTSCSPGCGAEVALAPEEDLEDILVTLRSLEREVLTKTSRGERWAKLYRKHGLEVVWIILEDAPFRQEVRDDIRHWMPMIRGLLQGETSLELTQQQVLAAYKIIDGFLARGGQELRDDLTGVRFTLESEGFLQVGMSSGDILRKLKSP